MGTYARGVLCYATLYCGLLLMLAPLSVSAGVSLKADAMCTAGNYTCLYGSQPPQGQKGPCMLKKYCFDIPAPKMFVHGECIKLNDCLGKSYTGQDGETHPMDTDTKKQLDFLRGLQSSSDQTPDSGQQALQPDNTQTVTSPSDTGTRVDGAFDPMAGELSIGGLKSGESILQQIEKYIDPLGGWGESDFLSPEGTPYGEASFPDSDDAVSQTAPPSSQISFPGQETPEAPYTAESTFEQQSQPGQPPADGETSRSEAADCGLWCRGTQAVENWWKQTNLNPFDTSAEAGNQTKTVIASTYGWNGPGQGDSSDQELAISTKDNPETLDKNPWTIAEKKGGLGEKYMLTNPRTKESVIVARNDRTPFDASTYPDGRTIDVSRAAAESISMGRTVGPLTMTPVPQNTPLGPVAVPWDAAGFQSYANDLSSLPGAGSFDESGFIQYGNDLPEPEIADLDNFAPADQLVPHDQISEDIANDQAARSFGEEVTTVPTPEPTFVFENPYAISPEDQQAFIKRDSDAIVANDQAARSFGEEAATVPEPPPIDWSAVAQGWEGLAAESTAQNADLAVQDTLDNFNNPLMLSADEQRRLVGETSQNILADEQRIADYRAQSILNNFYNPLVSTDSQRQALVDDMSQNVLNDQAARSFGEEAATLPEPAPTYVFENPYAISPEDQQAFIEQDSRAIVANDQAARSFGEEAATLPEPPEPEIDWSAVAQSWEGLAAESTAQSVIAGRVDELKAAEAAIDKFRRDPAMQDLLVRDPQEGRRRFNELLDAESKAKEGLRQAVPQSQILSATRPEDLPVGLEGTMQYRLDNGLRVNVNPELGDLRVVDVSDPNKLIVKDVSDGKSVGDVVKEFSGGGTIPPPVGSPATSPPSVTGPGLLDDIETTPGTKVVPPALGPGLLDQPDQRGSGLLDQLGPQDKVLPPASPPEIDWSAINIADLDNFAPADQLVSHDQISQDIADQQALNAFNAQPDSLPEPTFVFENPYAISPEEQQAFIEQDSRYLTTRDYFTADNADAWEAIALNENNADFFYGDNAAEWNTVATNEKLFSDKAAVLPEPEMRLEGVESKTPKLIEGSPSVGLQGGVVNDDAKKVTTQPVPKETVPETKTEEVPLPRPAPQPKEVTSPTPPETKDVPLPPVRPPTTAQPKVIAPETPTQPPVPVPLPRPQMRPPSETTPQGEAPSAPSGGGLGGIFGSLGQMLGTLFGGGSGQSGGAAGQTFAQNTYCITNLDPLVVRPVPAGTPFPSNCHNNPLTDGVPLAQKPQAPVQQRPAPTSASPTPTTPTQTPPPQNPSTLTPIVTIIANPNTVTVNGIATIAWSSVGTTKCTVSAPNGSQIGASATDGKATTPALATSTTFAILCTTTTGGTISGTTTVKVKVP